MFSNLSSIHSIIYIFGNMLWVEYKQVENIL